MAIKTLSALFFTFFLVIAASISLFSVWKVPIPTNTLLNGELTKAYEDEFDKTLAHRPWAISFYNTLHHRLFGEGRQGVLIGKDGWLFTDEEFTLSDDHRKNADINKFYIFDVQEQLAEHNIKLFIVPIPAKARILQENLGRYSYLEEWKRISSLFQLFLKAQKIPHNPHLDKVLSKQDLFLKTDTHWSPEGARAVAFSTALEIEKIFPYLTWKQEAFISKKDGKIDHKGDLTRYTVERSESINQWMTEAKNNSDDLFGNKNYDVVIVGTSYSANSLWNFDGFLKEALGTDVLNMADEGLGPFQVMKNYLASDQYKSDKPKLVIWEIPERYIPVLAKENS